MPKGKKRIQVTISAATKLSGSLMKLADRLNKFLNPRYDSANIRTYLNDARSQVTRAATQANQLPETWQPGKPKKPLTEEQIAKKRERLAKLLAEIEAIDG